jgi:hypothetical protein
MGPVVSRDATYGPLVPKLAPKAASSDTLVMQCDLVAEC